MKNSIRKTALTARLDLRVQIFREVIGNICAHSDYQPDFGGYVEVFYDRVITKNATRLIPTMKEGILTLDELGSYTNRQCKRKDTQAVTNNRT